ncbi:MAG: OB-fold nucleic acid binding domain-containing protein, partial [Pseudonocardiaceae bacterium]
LTAEEQPDGKQVSIAGMISAVQRKITKQGFPWAIVTVEDLDAAIEVLCFPKTYEVVSAHLLEDTAVMVRGRLNRREESSTSLIATDLALLDVGELDDDEVPIIISLPAARATIDLIDDLKRTLQVHPGTVPIRIKLRCSQRDILLSVYDHIRVDRSPSLLGELKGLLGAGCLE